MSAREQRGNVAHIVMRIPVLQGLIRRRLLVNFRVDPAVVQPLLPAPFRPKLHRGFALVGVCLLRLEQLRPTGWPSWLGLASEHAAHRIAVTWTDPAGADCEGVFIPRRDTGSLLHRLAGGRLFPHEHHPAQFAVTDCAGRIDLTMRSRDGEAVVRVVGADAAGLPATSCFHTLAEASAFFEGGRLALSVSQELGRLDALRLALPDSHARALAVTEASASYFADGRRFPSGAVQFDHALILRDLAHLWQPVEEMAATPAPA